MKKLQDKVAIVTGSSRGLGEAIALAFAREGANIVVASLGTDENNPNLPGTMAETAEKIRALGRKALPVACNVADEQSVINMVEQTLKEFGTIDILMNNAGVAVFQPTLELTAKRFDLVMAVNVRGTFLCSKYVLPTMIKNKKGNIINMSSNIAVSNHTRKAGQVYGMAKIAIERFTYGLASEMAEHNIAVNCVKPKGTISTEGMRFQQQDPAVQAKWETSEMIEKAAIFLAQQDAQHGVSGTISTEEELCTWHAL
jgi:citronellol/citronellal dehydrogenase